MTLRHVQFLQLSFNITSKYGNNTLTLGKLGTNYSLTFPDGYYSSSDMNSFLQSYMYGQNLYMTTSTGQIVYFLEIQANSARYALQ